MSYDVGIGDQWFNYTYNVSRLFHDHMDGGLAGLAGLTGRQAFRVLSDAFDAINRTRIDCWSESAVGEPQFCAKYDAPNGWGSAVGGLIFLALVMAACAQNPRTIVKVC